MERKGENKRRKKKINRTVTSYLSCNTRLKYIYVYQEKQEKNKLTAPLLQRDSAS
jgi:hypothetical protein